MNMELGIPKNVTKETIDFALSLVNQIETQCCLNSETFFQYGSSVAAIKRDRVRLLLHYIRTELQDADVVNEKNETTLSLERYNDSVDDTSVPESFIDAVKTAADLYKVIETFQSIGVNLEGYAPDSNNNIGTNIWAAITNATNIALRELGYDIGDENANEVFQNFICDYHQNGNNEDEISSYYSRYKIGN